MKKLLFFLFSFFLFGTIFQACSDDKTYAEQMKDERNAIAAYIKENNIKVITLQDFEKDTITNVAENEYVQFGNGVYMQIVNRGEGDTIKNRDQVIVRFTEYNIMKKQQWASNFYDASASNTPDVFDYFDQQENAYGLFSQSYLRYWYIANAGMTASNFSTGVPVGWLVPIKYIKNLAHVKIIVPHKIGHSYAQQQVAPFFYELHRIQIY